MPVCTLARGQAKLRDMEARLKLKEASLFEAGGVAAVAARDSRGNVVFRFDEQQCAPFESFPFQP